MKHESAIYLNRLKKTYELYGDNEGLMALANIQNEDERHAELAQYRQLDKTKQLIKAAMTRFNVCIQRLTNPEENLTMTDVERAQCFATMDWARYTLDIVGESPEQLDGMVDKMIMDRVGSVGSKLI